MNSIMYMRLINRAYIKDGTNLSKIFDIASKFNIGIKIGNISGYDDYPFIDSIYLNKKYSLEIQYLWMFLLELSIYLDCYNGAMQYTFLELMIKYLLEENNLTISGETQIVSYYDHNKLQIKNMAVDMSVMPIIHYRYNEHERILFNNLLNKTEDNATVNKVTS